MSKQKILSFILALILIFSNLAVVGHAQEPEYNVMITSINPEGGNALYAVPVQNASFKAYWVQLGAHDDINSLVLEVVKPSNPNLVYQPASGTILTGLMDNQNAWNNGILIKVFDGNTQVDTLALYVSSQTMPQDPPLEMPKETDLPAETERPVETVTPGTVGIDYVDENGVVLAQSTQTLHELGAQTIYVDFSLIPSGYRLSDVESKQVELLPGGQVNPASISFAVQKEQVAVNASLYVVYVDETGEQITQETVTLTEVGVSTIHVNTALLPADYEIVGESSKNVEVYSDNTINPDSITFQVKKKKQLSAVVHVNYVDAQGGRLNSEQITLTEVGVHTISAKQDLVPEGYTLMGESTVQVELFADGNLSRDTVDFGFQAPVTETEAPQIQPVEITVVYVDKDGQQVANEKQTLESIGAHTIIANAALVPDYDIVGENSAIVELYNDNSVSLETVSFQVQKKASVDPAINPVTVNIRYVDQTTSNDIHTASEITLTTIGEHSFADKIAAIDNYEYVSANAQSIYVFEDGHAEPAELVLSYKATGTVQKTIPVKYQTADGKEVAPSHDANLVQGENTITAQVTKVDGYTLKGAEAQVVTLYEDGSTSLAQVVFEFEGEGELPDTTETNLGEAEVNTADVNIRKKVDGDIIKKLDKGTKVTVLELLTGKNDVQWARIQYEGTKKAYIVAKFLDMKGAVTKAPTEQPQPSPSPAVTEPANVTATLKVEFVEGQTVLYEYEESLQGAGEHTVVPRQVAETANYSIQGEASQKVTLSSEGVLDKTKITFQFTKKALHAEVNIHYVDMNGQQIAENSKVSFDKSGDYTVEPQSIPSGFVLQEPKSFEVYVNESGEATPADVSFKFAPATVEGKVQIEYKDNNGTSISENTTQTLTTVGENTITPAVLLTDYELTGMSSQVVTLGQDGKVTPSTVTFTYQKKQQQVSGTVTIHYVGPEGVKLAEDTVYTLNTVGTENILPKANISSEYLLEGDPFQTVTLNADGSVQPAEITFEYTLAEKPPVQINVPVIIKYLDSNYYPMAEDDVVYLTSVGKHTITPKKTFNNATLDTKTIAVEVNANGIAVPNEAIFVYQKVTPKNPEADITVLYVDRNGTQIAPSTTKRINVVGNNTIMASPSGLPSQYQLVGENQINVVLNADSTASPNPVVFVYKNINDNFEHYRGFALTNSRVALRNNASTSDTAISQMLERNTLLFIAGQTQANGIVYHSVQTLSGAAGFITDADITKITQEQAQPYIDAYNQQNPGTNPPQATAITGYATTLGMDVPLRQLASGYSQIIQTLPTGTVMYLTGQIENNEGYTWRVAQYNGRLGYVRSDQVRALSTTEVNTYLANNQTTAPSNTAAPTYNPNSASSYGYVTTNDVNFRTQPNKSSSVITKIQRYGLGLVKETRVENGVTWYKINFNGREGYVQGDFFKQLTIHEFNQFINSSEYRAGLQNNSSTSTGGTNTLPRVNPGSATPGNVQTLESYNAEKWKNPNLAQASYPPFMPNISAMPTALTGAEASPSPTMIVLGSMAPAEFGMGASASPGISTSPNPDDTAITERTDSSSPLLAILGISVLAIGGAAGYTVYAKNKRKKMIAQAKARQAQMQAARQASQGSAAASSANASAGATRDPFANPNGFTPNNFGANKPASTQTPNASGYAQRKPMQDDIFKKPSSSSNLNASDTGLDNTMPTSGSENTGGTPSANSSNTTASRRRR